jgi:hypothetical protein
MPYIGNTVQNQGFSPAVDYFDGDGTTVTFTLSRPVASVAQLTAVIENVIQNPSTAFNVSGNEITFTSAPPAGTNNVWVEYTSLVTTYAAISQDPSVIGDITATGGYLAEGDFGNSFIDGTIVDYVTGNARITTGPSDGLTIYNGGTSARTAMGTFDTSGNFTNNATGYTKIATGTTAQRPGTPVVGMIRFNTTLNSYEIYDGTSWKILNYSDAANSYAVEYLICAGGGGGGSDNSGGGGGGGVITGTTFVQNGSYDIVVGAGGAGAPGGNIDSQTNGGNSSAFINWGQTALGGGFGANGNSAHRPAGSGGSGGGGEGENSSREAGGAGTFGQGFAGGNALTGSGYGGGGGGAGGVGNNSVAGLAGNGGQGLLSAINGTARYYGSGGGGSGIGDGGTGGSFSGFGIGNGNTGVGAGTNGETNSGGGGGGGTGTSDAGGNGGSGIVIIRYLGSARATGGSITSSGGYTIHTFTSSGQFNT